MLFEVAVILITIALVLFLQSKNKDAWKVFLIAAIGVLLGLRPTIDWKYSRYYYF